MAGARFMLSPAFLSSLLFSLGDGIVATLGIWVAAKYPPDRKSKSDEKAAFSECLNGIG